MKMRFFAPNSFVLCCQNYSAELRQTVHQLNGATVELAEAVQAIQDAEPNAVVCAYAGFIALRTKPEEIPTVLIRFDGSGAEAELFQPCPSAN